jgi:hypothetical protein
VAWDAGASLGGCYAFTYASSGCARWRHSLQYTLPGAFATALPAYWQRLPPPCAWQCCVPPVLSCLALVLASPAPAVNHTVAREG